MSSRCLLVVDRDPSVHEFLKGLLHREDRIVEGVFDGAEVAGRLRKDAVDVVLAGQGRNGTDGLAVLRRARSIRPETRVIVSGEPETERILGALRLGAYAYVHQPFVPGPLTDTVQQALEAGDWRQDIRVISARPEWITLEVRCKLETAERTNQYLRELLAGFKPHFREDLAAAFRELLMNAIEHGGRSDPHRRVRVALLRGSRFVIGHIADRGSGFSLDDLPHAAISNPADDPTKHLEVREESGRRPGGFGILMTRNLVDDLLYNERGNAVLFVKYLS